MPASASAPQLSRLSHSNRAAVASVLGNMALRVTRPLTARIVMRTHAWGFQCPPGPALHWMLTPIPFSPPGSAPGRPGTGEPGPRNSSRPASCSDSSLADEPSCYVQNPELHECPFRNEVVIGHGGATWAASPTAPCASHHRTNLIGRNHGLPIALRSAVSRESQEDLARVNPHPEWEKEADNLIPRSTKPPDPANAETDKAEDSSDTETQEEPQ